VLLLEIPQNTGRFHIFKQSFFSSYEVFLSEVRKGERREGGAETGVGAVTRVGAGPPEAGAETGAGVVTVTGVGTEVAVETDDDGIRGAAK